ncbi:MAG TPA: THUMP domain-containing protein [Rhabdochlamydiaceae bacterium]|nr:THUMP domain-containing protein [Rhabdochlamydiaceae bacterium]
MSDLFITCSSGLEDLLLKELQGMGISSARKGKSGVYASKDIRLVYKINYCSRIATRVLWPIANFPCPDKLALYREIKQIDWSRFLTLKKTFSIDSNVNHPNLRNSLFAALVVKDAICDLFREKTGARPNVEVASPDVQLNLFINHGQATISIDTSGAPLFKRGYRKQTIEAPIQESIAAAILQLSNYSSHEIFCDPFCGSGTFLIEAAMIATLTPAGFFRKSWGFVNLPQFTQSEWHTFRAQEDKQKIPLEKGRIFGIDVDPEAVKVSQANLQAAGFDEAIVITRKDIRSYFPDLPPTLIVCNPPYGKRLKASLDVYQALGKFLKTKCDPKNKAYILIPDQKLVQETNLPLKPILPLNNGGLEVGLYSI